MGTALLVVGASGTGKSASLRNLASEETFIINVVGKPLPFRGKGYSLVSDANPTGNVYSSDKASKIVNAIKNVNKDRPEIKYLIIDDAQYVMANDYMTHAMDVGYTKFNKIGQDFFLITNTLLSLRSDLHVAFMFHDDSSQSADGKRMRNAKTIGKMFDQYITLEGLFSVVLFTNTSFEDKKMSYGFATQTDGETTAKSPMGLFSDKIIDNDLKLVFDAMDEYYGDVDPVVPMEEVESTKIKVFEAKPLFNNDGELNAEEKLKKFTAEKVAEGLPQMKEKEKAAKKRTKEIISQLPKDMQPIEEDAIDPEEMPLDKRCERIEDFLAKNKVMGFLKKKSIFETRIERIGSTLFDGVDESRVQKYFEWLVARAEEFENADA